MKFEAKTIATLVSSTALAMAIGMGSAHAEGTDTQSHESGDGPTMPEHPEGKGAAPSTGMGGALRDEDVQGHDTSKPAGVDGEQSDQPEDKGDGSMGHDDAGTNGGGM